MITKNLITFLLSFICVFESYVFSQAIHELSVLDLDGSWKYISDKAIYKYPTWVAVPPVHAPLFLSCEATYPIQWTFTGHYYPSRSAKLEPPRTFKNDSQTIYYIRAELHLPLWDNSDWTASVRIACEKVEKPQVEKSVVVFVRKNSNGRILGPMEQTVWDSKLIPCPTNDPSVVPFLYSRSDKGNVRPVIDPQLAYNFYEGFQSNNPFRGIFICRSGNSSVTINALVSPSEENFEVFPKSNIIRVFSEGVIEIKCKSKLGAKVNLVLEDSSKKLDITYDDDGTSAVIKMTKDFSPAYSTGDVSRLEAKGKCTVDEDGREVVVKEWSYEFLKTPELHLNSFKRSVDCLSNIKQTSVHVFRCNNKMDCSFLSKFSSTPMLDIRSSDIQTHFFSNQSGYCSLRGEQYGRLCIRLPYPYTSGLAQCNVDGLVKEWEFFTSLDNRKYVNWRDAPEKELIRMTEEKSINGVTQFFCSAVSFLFADSISFEIEFRNGSNHTVEHNGNSVNITDPHIREYQQIEGLTFIGILDIILPADTAAMHCIATWWNETGEMRTSRKYDFPEDEGTMAIYMIIGAAGIFVICMLLFLLIIFIKRYKTAKHLLRNLTDEEVEQFLKGRPELLASTKLKNIATVDLLPFPEEYEIPLCDLAFDTGANFLGFGNFSYVVRGTVISKGITVAIKISKPSANVDFFKSLLSEVKIMVYIGKHVNVLSLTGVCTENIRNRCIHIATDVCELGDLKNFLLKARPSFQNIINGNQEIDISLITPTSSGTQHRLTILDLIRFSCEIAKGMEYLAYKSVIHADLAARNVLLTSNKNVKISDFGLSKKLYENTNYVKKSSTPLPWRWMALESLTTLTFSTSSDIWAYGVTLFEIFSLGDTPYPNEEWNTAFLARLEDGMRMGRPKHSTKEIYHILSECWEKEPELRPSFSTLRSFFERLSGRYLVGSSSSSKVKEPIVPTQNSEAASSLNESIYKPLVTVENEPYADLEETHYMELHEYTARNPVYGIETKNIG